MCTIIGIIDPNPLTKIAFMSNRDKPSDKPYEGEDFRIIDDKIVGVYDYRSKGLASGFSLETKIYGAVANLLGYVTEYSRGVLLYKILQQASTLNEAIELIYNEIKTGKYSAAIYVLGDKNNLVKIENFKTYVNIKWFKKNIVVTNVLENSNLSYYTENSKERAEFALRYLSEKHEITLDDLMNLARYHGGIASICRHDINGQTLSSTIYALNKEGKLIVKYSKGNPCITEYSQFIFNTTH